jgi:large conductance mechanosensitive channel
MLRRTRNFITEESFLMRASIVELACGLLLMFALQKVISDFVTDILFPIMGALLGGVDFSNYFLALSSAVKATNLAEAQKQGAVLAYGDFLTTLINAVILLFITVLALRLLNKLVGNRNDQ